MTDSIEEMVIHGDDMTTRIELDDDEIEAHHTSDGVEIQLNGATMTLDHSELIRLVDCLQKSLPSGIDGESDNE